MNIFLVGLLKIIVLQALTGLVLAAHFFEDGSQRQRRWFNGAFVLVALLSVFAYFNFGSFRFEGGLVNEWEHYHFFLGSKYLPEIGYDAIYEASTVAIDERFPGSVDSFVIRDPMTFEMEAAREVLARKKRIKGRFSAQRWKDFDQDLWHFYGTRQMPIDRVLRDHGNTGSPVWGALARLFTNPFAASKPVLVALAFLDVVLLLILFVVIWRSFGLRPMLITLSVMLLAPRAYDFLGGSIFRLDWLVALGFTACALKARRARLAGVALAWAIASKPFCALFAMALGLRFLWLTWRRRSIDRHHVELVLSSVVALLLIVAVSSMALGGVGMWFQYLEKLQANLAEKYYWDNHGSRDIFLQVVHDGPTAVFDWTPDPVANSLDEVKITDHAVGFGIARAVLILLLIGVMTRHDDDVVAFGLGALWVWVIFVTNMYYWQMISLPVLAWAAAPQKEWRQVVYLVYVPVYFIASYVFVHLNLKHLEGFFGNCWLATYVVGIVAIELVAWRRSRLVSAPASQMNQVSGDR